MPSGKQRHEDFVNDSFLSDDSLPNLGAKTRSSAEEVLARRCVRPGGYRLQSHSTRVSD
jgi:hypothetical protein